MLDPVHETGGPIVVEPLDGVRVVSIADSLAVAYCGRVLTDAGAEVTLVEGPSGSRWRAWTCSRPLPAGQDGALFSYLHHGQRSVTAPAADRLTGTSDLLDGAHVLLTDRLDAAEIAVRYPQLVVVAVTPWGLGGTDADRPASELVIQAESGCLGIRGRSDRPPFQAGGEITEWVTGIYAAVATAAALRTGHGRLVDVSWLEVAALTGTNFADLFDSLRGRPDLTTVARSMETPSIEPTSDGYVGFNTNTRQQFDDFCVLIERPDLLADGAWASFPTRAARWDEWNAIVHAWTTQHTTAETVEAAAAFRIPCAPVADAPTLLSLQHVIDRGLFRTDPTGSFVVPRRPWTIDGRPGPDPDPAPKLGEPIGPTPPGGDPAPATSPGPGPDPAPVDAADAASSAYSGEARLPLDGVRVVDLTAWWAGPSAAGMLGALGADVIHVESCRRPDGMRMAGGMFADQPEWWERSGFFLQANTNKRGFTLDLATAEGRDLALRLIATADVVIENFTPRVLASFGLGWEVIHAANPRAVLVRMPAFGLTGPWRDRPGFAQTMEQVTGLAWLTGHVDDQPRIQRGPCDPNGGMHATFATLMALAHRDRSGEGCLVEAPMFEAALAVAAELTIEWTAYGTLLHREGNRSPHAAPQNLYATDVAEQWLALSVTDDAEWQALCGVLGRADWSADVGLATHQGRRARHDELDTGIGAWAADRSLESALRDLAAARVPAGRVTDPRRSSAQPRMAERGFFEAVDRRVIGTHPTPSVPFRFSGVDRWIRRPAPTIGEHNDELLDELGVTAEERIELTTKGVIGTRPIGL